MSSLGAPDRSLDTSVTLEHGRTSLLGLTILGLSAQQIGPGVALAGGYMILYAGNASWISMLIALLISSFLGAIVVAFSRRLVATGGLMSYVAVILGPYARALVGAGYIVGILIAVGAVVTGVVIFTASFFVQVGATWAATPLAQAVSACVIAAAAGLVAYRGVDTSVKVSAVLSFIGIPFVVWVTIAAATATADYSIASQFDFSGPDFSWDSIFGATLVALSYFVGFEGLSAMAGETKDPKRNLPRFVVLLLGATGITYIVTLWFQIPALSNGTELLAAGDSPTAVLALLGGLGWVAGPLDALMAIATFAALVATFNYGSRIVATAARAGLLPQRLSRISPRFRSPSAAVSLLVVMAAGIPVVFQVIAAAPPLESSVLLYTLFSYCYFIPYVVASIAAIVMVIRTGKTNIVMIVVYLIAGLGFGYLLLYALTSAGDGVFGALPWVAISLTALAFVAFVVAHRRNPNADNELADLL